MSATFNERKCQTTLFAALLAAKRLHGAGKTIVQDADGQKLTYRQLVIASLVLGAKLKSRARRGETIGVMLPNVAGLVVTLFGLNAFGRTVSLLNFTSGARNLRSAVCTGPVPLIVTSRRFVEAAKLGSLIDELAATEATPGRRVRIVYLDDVRAGIGALDKALGLLRALLAGNLHANHAQRPDDVAVLLFTSGTEGVPKGVALSNRNLVANARQIFAHAEGAISAADTMLNPLPMFHSFGLTAGTLMPVLSGMRAVLSPSPLQYREVARQVAATGASIMVATDTFLQGYARAATGGELKSIRFAVAGAERVKAQTRELWAKAGALIMEGYGATECSPVICCNIPHANRDGSVGRLLPGIEARLEPVEGIDEGGRLVVRGPNVMAGYMLPDKPGVLLPPHGGWHDTGDIVTIDDGFVTIRGRAKRFAKIGGEMISLAAVEGLAAALWPETNHVVVSLPDARKGESLLLITEHAGADREALSAHAKAQGFTDLSVPRSIIVVASIPILGSGKVDFPAVLDLVRRVHPDQAGTR